METSIRPWERGKLLFLGGVGILGLIVALWWGLSYPSIESERIRWSDVVFELCVLLFLAAGLVAWLQAMPDSRPLAIPLGLAIMVVGAVANVTDEFRRLPPFLQDLDRYVHLIGFAILAVGLFMDRQEKLRLFEENRKATEEIRASEARYRALLDNSLVGVYLIEDGRFRYVNQEFCRIFGYSKEEIENRLGPLDLTAPEWHPAVKMELEKRISGEKLSSRYSFKAVRKDGSLIDVEVHGSRLEYGGRIWIHGVIVDLTEKRRAEEEKRFVEAQLAQAQRMEAIGTLASGIAHDFNNLLTTVLGNVCLLRSSADLSADLRGALEAIETAGRKASELTRRLLALAKGDSGKRQAMVLGDAVREIVELARRTFPKNIRVESYVAPDLPPIEGNPAEIEQCLLNLCINARDAMPEGGTLRVRAAGVQRDELGPAGLLLPERKRYAEILVEDTGIGMSEEVREHIFEPFFTSKDGKGGTGLGLAIVFKIVRDHDGWICADSAPGKGTRFRVLLPGIG
ncbi:MAG: PAS domain S-box protein [candidate division KSB1 bacterium]|nr:PAS domain S-box protein [candidate division KSB1 bacterium]